VVCPSGEGKFGLGEQSYAEGNGDRADLALASEDVEAVSNLKKAGLPVVVILISGRPMIINGVFDQADAFVVAWLPATEGQGVAAVLFGDYKATGKLSHSWPRAMSQMPINIGDANLRPAFQMRLRFELLTTNRIGRFHAEDPHRKDTKVM